MTLRHQRRALRPLGALTAAVLVGTSLVACGSSPRPSGSGPVTITVPGDAATIQEGVDAAREGDLVLVSPGVYREEVRVSTPGITLRGADRAGVVIDGEVQRPNGVVVTADRVRVQNLTVRNNIQNGVLVTGLSDADGEGVARTSDGYTPWDPAEFPPVQGFHVDHVTASNNGLYGIYAFDSQHGLIENSYASGGADSGIYVGQCKPCSIVVRDNVAERNAVGYEGANAGPELYLVGNRFAGNRVGATILSDYQEAFVPQTGTTVVGNVLGPNNAADTPEQADGGYGIGIGISGGTQNLVVANRVAGNETAGLVVTSSEDLGPIDNTIRGNLFTEQRLDAVYAPTERGPGSGNCLADNELTTTVPADLATVAACGADGEPSPGDYPAVQAPAGVPFTQVAAPPVLPDLPDVATVPAVWQVGDLPVVDPDQVAVPDADLLSEQSGLR